MRHRALNVLRRSRTAMAAREMRTASDGDLLARFVARRDENAFSALVHRHGPLVLGVCRRLLTHRQDAEDAFQATFLVLARQAGAIRRRESLASWLHGVARRTALRLRAESRRRSTQHLGDVEPVAPGAAPSAALREAMRIVDEELAALPAHYRAPLVLCYLEGRTQDEAAGLLGWTAGAFRGRLERGRDMLRRRLTRRGVSFPAALVGLGLGATAAPAALVSATVNAAVPLAGQTAAGVSAVTVQVAEGVCRAMVMHRIRGAGIALGLALLTALGGVAIVPGVDGPAQSAAAGDTPSKESPKADAAGPAADPGIKDADPEKLFKRMEQRLLTCKTLDVQMEFAGVAEKDVKGRLLVARGNKMRLEFDMTAAGRPHKATTVSDGARMRTIGAIPRLNDQTPKQLTEIVLSSVTRGGVWLTMAELLEKQDPATESKDFDLEKSLAVSDFKLGTKEQVAGREAQVIEYKVKTADEPLVMTVWIDVRTDLPLKRVVKGKDKDGPYQVLMTETYTKVGVDEKIDDKVFEVPK